MVVGISFFLFIFLHTVSCDVDAIMTEALQAREEADCTFQPNTSKLIPPYPSHAPADAPDNHSKLEASQSISRLPAVSTSVRALTGTEGHKRVDLSVEARSRLADGFFVAHNGAIAPEFNKASAMRFASPVRLNLDALEFGAPDKSQVQGPVLRAGSAGKDRVQRSASPQGTTPPQTSSIAVVSPSNRRSTSPSVNRARSASPSANATGPTNTKAVLGVWARNDAWAQARDTKLNAARQLDDLVRRHPEVISLAAAAAVTAAAATSTNSAPAVQALPEDSMSELPVALPTVMEDSERSAVTSAALPVPVGSFTVHPAAPAPVSPIPSALTTASAVSLFAAIVSAATNTTVNPPILPKSSTTVGHTAVAAVAGTGAVLSASVPTAGEGSQSKTRSGSGTGPRIGGGGAGTGRARVPVRSPFAHTASTGRLPSPTTTSKPTIASTDMQTLLQNVLQQQHALLPASRPVSSTQPSKSLAKTQSQPIHLVGSQSIQIEGTTAPGATPRGHPTSVVLADPALRQQFNSLAADLDRMLGL
jgi:hypothetical protein